MVNLEISGLLEDLNIGHIFEQQIEDFIDVDFRLRNMFGIGDKVVLDFHGYQHFFRNEEVLRGSNILKRKLLEGLGYFYLEIWVTDWNLKDAVSEQFTQSKIDAFSKRYPGVKQQDLGRAMFLLSLIERDFNERYQPKQNPVTKSAVTENHNHEKNKVSTNCEELAEGHKEGYFSQDEGDDFDSTAVFETFITYCSDCGYESRAKYVSDVIKSVYPLSSITLQKSVKKDGSFEIKVASNAGEKLVHSKLKGDGYVTEDNIYELMLEIEDALQPEEGQ